MAVDDKNPSAQTAPEQRYNGWANYETWCVNLWLTNDQGTYDWIVELRREYERPADLAAAIRDYLEAQNPAADKATVYADLLRSALDAVDWQQVAENFIDE